MLSRIWKEAWLGESGGEAVNRVARALHGSPHLEQENQSAKADAEEWRGREGGQSSEGRAWEPHSKGAWGLLWP